jgi:hypothetical protein
MLFWLPLIIFGGMWNVAFPHRACQGERRPTEIAPLVSERPAASKNRLSLASSHNASD